MTETLRPEQSADVGRRRQTSVVADLRPPETASALVRKLGAMTLISEEEIAFLEGLQNNTVSLEPEVDFIFDGDDLKASFIVRSGWAIRYVMLNDGRRQILGYVLPGDILGLHINFRRKASYCAAALTDLELAVVEPLRMIDISRNYPIIAAGLSWSTAREFAILGDHAVRLGRLSSFKRFAHLFLELWHRLRLIGETEGPTIEMPMCQQHLADTLGLSLVHTNKTLRRLRESGLVEIGRNHITLRDIPKLTELAEFNPDHLSEFTI